MKPNQTKDNMGIIRNCSELILDILSLTDLNDLIYKSCTLIPIFTSVFNNIYIQYIPKIYIYIYIYISKVNLATIAESD